MSLRINVTGSLTPKGRSMRFMAEMTSHIVRKMAVLVKRDDEAAVIMAW